MEMGVWRDGVFMYIYRAGLCEEGWCVYVRI